jgi:hypothetical protein
MVIEMINKFLKVVISAVILSASGYANIASAIDIKIMPTQEPLLTTYEWSATCYDCKNGNIVNVRPDDRTLWKGVTGSITLSDYTLGEAITLNNFISFAYTGESQFLPMFTIGNGIGFDYSPWQVSGTLFANADLTFELTANNNFAPPLRPPVPVQYTLDELRDELYATNHGIFEGALIFCDMEFAGVDIHSRDRCYLFAVADYNSVIERLLQEEVSVRLTYLESYADLLLQYDNIMAIYVNQLHLVVSLLHWEFGDYGLANLDVGEEFLVHMPFARFSTVNEPATLAIFALGLMGLVLRRFKKQS